MNRYEEIKEYYDNEDFDMKDVVKISRGTTKEDDLFDYAEIPNYLKTIKKNCNNKENNHHEISL